MSRGGGFESGCTTHRLLNVTRSSARPRTVSADELRLGTARSRHQPHSIRAIIIGQAPVFAGNGVAAVRPAGYDVVAHVIRPKESPVMAKKPAAKAKPSAPAYPVNAALEAAAVAPAEAPLLLPWLGLLASPVVNSSLERDRPLTRNTEPSEDLSCALQCINGTLKSERQQILIFARLP